ncbi:hypothetical protein RYX36_007871 [Vicia faba]
MVQRLQGMEQVQQQMMSFLSKVVQSPGFFAQFMQQQNDSNRRITEVNKKRRLKQEGIAETIERVSPYDGEVIKYQPQMNETAKAMLRNIMKWDTPWVESFNKNPDNYLIGDGTSLSNTTDNSSSSKLEFRSNSSRSSSIFSSGFSHSSCNRSSRTHTFGRCTLS